MSLSFFFLFLYFFFFFFNDTATTEIYTLSLHDALPISPSPPATRIFPPDAWMATSRHSPSNLAARWPRRDRKSTRLNSSHSSISYAVFCLKKKTLNNYIFHPLKKKKTKLLES